MVEIHINDIKEIKTNVKIAILQIINKANHKTLGKFLSKMEINS